MKKFCKQFKKDNNSSKGDPIDGKAEANQVVGTCGSVFTVCHRGGKTEKTWLPVVKSKKRLISHMRYDGATNSYVVKEGSCKNVLQVLLQVDAPMYIRQADPIFFPARPNILPRFFFSIKILFWCPHPLN